MPVRTRPAYIAQPISLQPMIDTPPPAPRVTHSRILAVAVPAILANFAAALPNLVDTALIGRMSDTTALGGISVGASLSVLVLWAFAFLQFGTTGFTAQAYRAEDGDEIKATLTRALTLAWILGFVLLIIVVPLAFIAIPLFGSTEAVADLAARYFHYRLFSAPFDFTNYVIFGWLVGLQRVGRALALQLLLNGLNIFLCWLFVYCFRFGVDGAAIATAIAQVVTAISGFVVARRLLRIVPLTEESGLLIDLDKVFVLLSVNFDVFLRTLVVIFMMAYFVGLGARMGDVTLAANQLLLVLVATIAQCLDGFAQSSEALTEEAMGQRDRGQLRRAVGGSLFWALVLATGLSLLLQYCGNGILNLFGTDSEVGDKATIYLPWLVSTPLVAVGCYIFEGAFISAARGREMRNCTIIAALAAIVAQYFAIPDFGNDGLWGSLILFFALRSVMLCLLYLRIPRALAH